MNWNTFGIVLTLIGTFLTAYTVIESKLKKDTNDSQNKPNEANGTATKAPPSSGEKKHVIKPLWWSSVVILLAGFLSLGLSHAFPTSEGASSPGNNSSPSSGITRNPQNTTTPTNPIATQISATLTATAMARAQGIYEAEDPQNTLGGEAYVEKCPRCSNGLVVFNIGAAPNVSPNIKPGTLQFNDVYAAKDGKYWMIVTYCGHYSFDNYAYVSVNGGLAFQIHYLPAGDCLKADAKLGTLFVAISLYEGNNTIKFSNPHADSSYIDKITIQPINS